MDIPKAISDIMAAFGKKGFEVAIVGGAVRDLIASGKVSDWDLTTSAKPEQILKLFKNSFYNNRFGTVGIELADKSVVQITTYRSEEKYSDKRHPDIIVWGKTLEEDLKRRDFTINAMALRLPKANGNFTFSKKNSLQRTFQIARFERVSSRKANFELVDPFGGQGDLKKKVIRTVGDPDERFGEDALRLLRAIRFAATLDFEIEAKTLSAIAKNANLLSSISGERIRDELFKILESGNAYYGFELLRDSALLKIILPELDVCFSVEQKSPKRHHIFDVGTHCVMSLKFCPSGDIIVRFATLLHDIGKAKVAKVTDEGVRTFYNHEVVGGKQVLKIADRLHLAKADRERLYKLVRYHQFTVNENQTDKALRRFIRNIGRENIEDMMDLRIGDRLGGGLQQPESWRLKLFRQRLKEVLKKPFTVADLKINGLDVMKVLGLSPGPRVGKILNKLFEEVADDKTKNNRDYLLERLRSMRT